MAVNYPTGYRPAYQTGYAVVVDDERAPLSPEGTPRDLEDSYADSDGEESVAEHEGSALDEDIYGLSITSLLRDSSKLTTGHGRFCVRLGRLIMSVLLLLATVVLAAFLIVEMKLLVTPAQVLAVRKMYDDYEEHMYHNHTSLTVNGFRRGVDGFFDASRFPTLDEGCKGICSIPLSHPWFFGCILFIWTLTVSTDIRKILSLSRLLLLQVPSVKSVEEMFTRNDAGRVERTEDGKVHLEGLPRWLKLALTCTVFLPRFLLDSALLWLGCRWLVSTVGLQDVLLNAVALEFILNLKDLLYWAVVPDRNKLETQQMLIPERRKEVADCSSYLAPFFFWLALPLSWTLLYMFYLQAVLPDYKWDVRATCNMYKVSD